MSMPPDNIIKLSETLLLSQYASRKSGHFGFWLHDKTRGMNLALRAESERDAFVKALTYYQKRLTEVEDSFTRLQLKVDAFVGQFTGDEE